MATTAVFAEILIVGLEVEAWILVAVLAVSGTDWIDTGDAADFAGLVLVVVLALAYVLGILVDRLADTFIDWVEDRDRGKSIKKRLMKHPEFEKPADVAPMRMMVMHESEGMTRFLDYQRSRWRITRATIVNLAVLGVAGALYLGLQVAWYWLFVPLAGALVLIAITYFAGVRIQEAWVERLSDAYGIVSDTSKA